MRHVIRGLVSTLVAGLVASVALEVQVAGAKQSGRFVKPADGLTVHDNLLHVTWLADANYPATQKFGLPVKDGGAMTFPVARRWVAALNASNGGVGYLGHRNWTLPATPPTDETCSVARGPHGNSFGFTCMNSPLGSLYYKKGLGLREPNTAVPRPMPSVHSGISNPIFIGL